MNRGLFYMMLVMSVRCVWLMPAEAVAQQESSDSASYLLGAGDVLEVRVWEEEDLSGDLTINESGMIDLPLVGEIAASGRTVDQVSEELRARLAKDFLVEPQVSVSIKTHVSQPVLVQGAVRKPDRYLLSRSTTLLEILAEAGGVLVEKSSQEVHLTRQGGDQTIVVKLDALLSTGEGNVVLQAGDVIYVPENEVVYVSGQVVKPGAVNWRDGLTVIQAVTEAGGASPGANLRKAYVLRGRERIEINLRRVMRGKDADQPLLAGDQLFIDESVL